MLFPKYAARQAKYSLPREAKSLLPNLLQLLIKGTHRFCKKGLWLLESGRKEEEHLLLGLHFKFIFLRAKTAPAKPQLWQQEASTANTG